MSDHGRPAGGSGLRRFIGTVAGLGRLPFGPGTWASLATVLVLGLLLGVEGQTAGLLPAGTSVNAVALGLLAVAVVLLVVGIRVGDRAVEDYGKGDPGAFVLDEVVGQMLPVIAVFVMAQASPPSEGPAPLPPFGLALAFLSFRVFDIAKPPPIRQIERLGGGLGIMADDVVAGLLALLVVVLVASGGAA